MFCDQIIYLDAHVYDNYNYNIVNQKEIIQFNNIITIFFVVKQLSPFTDLDSEPSVLVAKWHCAKNAFVTIMRSWTGVIQLTSDELGLTTLVLMLRDTKVSGDVVVWCSVE